MLQPILKNNLQKVAELCKQHHVEKLYAFGSVCTEHFNDESDIDLLYRFKSNFPLDSYEANYLDFEAKIQQLLNREVDLVPEKYLSNPYFIKKVNETKTLVYG
ncbi:MAG: nucleotidyltransferase domain-containing protein [Chitinophagales bacterium]|nr:nucleotidyltransferase domain-containing protein [Chitinophagales bacterium]